MFLDMAMLVESQVRINKKWYHVILSLWHNIFLAIITCINIVCVQFTPANGAHVE